MSEGTLGVDCGSPRQLATLRLFVEHACGLLVGDHTQLETVHLKSWLIKTAHSLAEVNLLGLVLVILLGHSMSHGRLA